MSIVKEKVVVANSKLKSVEVESSKLMKDLIEAMDETDKAKRRSRRLVVQQFMKSEHFSNLQFIQYYKGFELLCKWTMKHQNQVVDFSNLDFEAINTEVLADKAKEQEETTTVATGGGGATNARQANAGRANPGQGDKAFRDSINMLTMYSLRLVIRYIY
nr:hypothetical protein CFP56_08456 [Quercus suber]